MSNSVMRCRVRKNSEGYEGTVFVNGLKPTKLVKKDETSVYANRSGVVSAAKACASRFGMTLEVEDTETKTKTKTATPTIPTSDSF